MEHSHDLCPEHPHDFLIGHRYVAHCDIPVFYHMVRLDISYGQKQRPETVLISIQILECDILIDPLMDRLPTHQLLNLMLAPQRMPPDHFTDQLVAAGIDPVRLQLTLPHIIADGPWVVDIFPVSNNKTIVHGLHILHSIDVLAFQRILDLLLGKAKTVTVIIAGNRTGFQIIHIGKQRVPGYFRDTGDNRAV